MNILGYKYTVTADTSADTMGAFGRFHSSQQQLQIASDLCDEQKVSTVLHEIIEAINYHSHLEMAQYVIASLETGLFQVCKANGVDLLPLAKDVLK